MLEFIVVLFNWTVDFAVFLVWTPSWAMMQNVQVLSRITAVILPIKVMLLLKNSCIWRTMLCTNTGLSPLCCWRHKDLVFARPLLLACGPVKWSDLLSQNMEIPFRGGETLTFTTQVDDHVQIWLGQVARFAFTQWLLGVPLLTNHFFHGYKKRSQ